MTDQLIAVVQAAVAASAALAGVVLADGSYEIEFSRDNGWDRLYRVALPPLPGGPGHLALVPVATAPAESRGQARTEQLDAMMRDHRLRLSRLAAIRGAGLDPLSPPAWSIEGQAATVSVLKALAGRVSVEDFQPTGGGPLDARLDGLEDEEAEVLLRDGVLTWSTSPARAPERRWRYSDTQRELLIHDVALPETTCQAIVRERRRVSEIVRGGALERVEARVAQASSRADGLLLQLEPGWEWLAPLPEGIEGSWRRGL